MGTRRARVGKQGGQSREKRRLESGKKGVESGRTEARVGKCGTKRHVNLHDVSYPKIMLVDCSCAGTPQAKVTVAKTKDPTSSFPNR